MAGMDETNQLARFDRAAAVAGSVIDGVKPGQFDSPTPCIEWTVQQLMNHLVGGNRMFISLAGGGDPVDRAQDFIGDDPSGAYRESAALLREVFAGEGALARIVPTPFGERPAALLVEMRVVEMMTHGWDLARATGQSTDLDPEVAESCIPGFRRLRAEGRGGAMFADEQPAPPGATAADRLAAVAGRAVA
jgi:uncharacterized protein (TIGR03086 family)